MKKRAWNKRQYLRSFLIKNGTFLFFIIIYCSFSYGQTDSSILKTYNSIKEWENSGEKFENFLKEENFKGGDTGFYEFFGNNIFYPELEMEFCSQAIVLMTIGFSSDSTIDLKFHNSIRKGYKEEIKKAFNKSIDLWKWGKMSYRKKRMNWIISFSINGITDEHGFCLDEFYHSTPSEAWECRCFFTDNETIWRKAQNSKENRTRVFYLNEYLQRNPFSKEAHQLYYKATN